MVGAFALAVFCLAADGLQARSGMVQTLDGQFMEGAIRLVSGSVQVSNETGVVQVGLNQVALLTLEASGPAVGPVPAGKGNGLLGLYYASTNLTGHPRVQLDQAVYFDWGTQEPARGVGKDYFSILWMGELEAPASGDYTFYMATDDGGRLRIGDMVLLERWQRQEAVETTVTLALEAGKRYPLRMEYFDSFGNARARLLWSGPELPKSIIPRERLYAASFLTNHGAEISSEQGLLATFYKNPDFTGPTYSHIQPVLDYHNLDQPPGPGISSTNFSARWTGQARAGHSEPHTFHIVSDKGMRLWLDGQLVIDRWDQSTLGEASATMPLVAGQRYDLEIEVPNRSGATVAKLLWSSPSIPRTVIPQSCLFPSKPASSRGITADTSARMPAGLVLRGGSFLACDPRQGSESIIEVSSGVTDKPISLVNVARIYCQPLSKTMQAKLQPGRIGVLMLNGDFVDGDFQGWEDGQIRISSILLGLRSFEAGREVSAVVLRETLPGSWQYEVRLRDQSILFAGDLAVDSGSLDIKDPVLGSLKIPEAELLQVRRAEAVLQSK